MSQALYRKYRSRSLDEIVGQDHITSLLRRAISNGSIAHAYLLTGPRGVGKTSIARIIAHEINGLAYTDESNHLDIIEIDAASNNGVEDVRDLRDKVHIAPSQVAKKVYIIDEVHMLSKPAFNALLKTLEEPPAHVVFILATTDVEKLPATIISRVQQFNFRAIDEDTLAAHLRFIADQESINIDDAALALLARYGKGSFRDSISLLDQLRHSAEANRAVTAQDVQQALGAGDDERLSDLISAYRSANLTEIVATISALESAGVYAGLVTSQLIARLQATIIEHPEDLPTLDRLLEVTNSSYPYIKLLTALASNQSAASRSAQDEPAEPRPSTPTESRRRPAAKSKAAPVKAKVDSQPDATASDSAGEASQPASTASFSWEALLAAIDKDIALKSLLSRCKHDQDGTTVTIYAGSKFNAQKLSSTRQQPKLRTALEKIGASDLSLNIRAEKPPLGDSQTAAVAAIMGGGEEVAYNG